MNLYNNPLTQVEAISVVFWGPCLERWIIQSEPHTKSHPGSIFLGLHSVESIILEAK